MTLANNIIVMDINYLEFASFTGTHLHTETASYARDNRSADLVDFSTCTGTFVADFGVGGYFNIDTFILANHNLVDFYFQYYTGTAWVTYGSAYTSNSATTTYYNSGSVTSYIQDVQVVFTKTVNSEPAYFGEFIATKKKFQLAYNPSGYEPQMESNGPFKKLWTGKQVYNERSDNFTAVLQWRHLQGDPLGATNTDLQNMTELARKKTSFLFWPNANNDYISMFTWRKQDIFKCKITNDTTYEFSANNLDYMLNSKFIIWEMK